MNKKLEIPEGGIFAIGKIKSDITEKPNDINDKVNDSNHDSTNDIIIETGNIVDNINVPIILRLKPSTVQNLDNIAYKTRRSRNYVAQQLLDQAMKNVKLK
jgi:hypothetical protein